MVSGAMQMKNILKLFGLLLAIILIFTIFGCTSSSNTSSTSTKPGGGAVVNSDSVITAKIQSITRQSTGYPWKLDILIQASSDVDSLTNPTKDSIGKVITVQTDEDISAFKMGDIVTARVKYTGDVNIPGGIKLYIYNIAKQTNY
jgi:hypothetical protein